MSYKISRVNYAPEEHAAAQQLDEAIETVHNALKNGVGIDDVMIMPGVLIKLSEVIKFVSQAPTKQDRAIRIAKVGTALIWDNLGGLGT